MNYQFQETKNYAEILGNKTWNFLHEMANVFLKFYKLRATQTLLILILNLKLNYFFKHYLIFIL